MSLNQALDSFDFIVFYNQEKIIVEFEITVFVNEIISWAFLRRAYVCDEAKIKSSI